MAGRPCIGSWISYGLGSLNRDLPTFVVMNAERSHPKAGQQAISAKLWSSGFLSPEFAGVGLRAGNDPVLYVKNPAGVTPTVRRRMLDGLAELNQINHERIGDPETLARIEQYEMAFRMQTSVPELSDLSAEPESTWKRWGEEAREPGKFQNAALMARRLVERGVRFVQIYHRGWDVHGNLPLVLPAQAREADRGAWALIQDLKERGLFEDTLVIWGGEFGRTIYSQGRTDTNRLRSGPSSAMLQPLDGRSRDQGRYRPRRNRRILVQHRQGPGPHPRLPGNTPAPVRNRPPAVHISTPRLGCKAHWCGPCKRRDADSGLTVRADDCLVPPEPYTG